MNSLAGKPSNLYFCTFTYPGSLLDIHVKNILDFFKHDSTFCVVAREYGASGTNLHIHTVSDSNTKGYNISNYRRKAIKVYPEEVAKCALKIKKVTDLNGILQYVTKDANVLLVQGWKPTWITDLANKSFHKRKHFQKLNRVSAEQFPYFMKDYCKQYNLNPPTNKNEFALIMKHIHNNNYSTLHLQRYLPFIYYCTAGTYEDYIHSNLRFET